MTDIVRPDRARFIAVKAATMRQMFNNHEMLASEVEARLHLEEVETLLAEIKRLRGALHAIDDTCYNGDPVKVIAKAALSNERLTKEN